jgi:protein SCO1/2
LCGPTPAKQSREADFADKPKAIFFGFTYCPDVCPTTLFELSTYLDRLGPLADNLHVLMVSVDPQRDTPEFLERLCRPRFPTRSSG